MGRLQKDRIVFANTPDIRVYTQPMPGLYALLNQRRRWVSRYFHIMHYHPAFFAAISVLGAQSIVLSLGVVLAFFNPALMRGFFRTLGSQAERRGVRDASGRTADGAARPGRPQHRNVGRIASVFYRDGRSLGVYSSPVSGKRARRATAAVSSKGSGANGSARCAGGGSVL